jgi:tetratricopeptide (TPR) repeat protein
MRSRQFPGSAPPPAGDTAALLATGLGLQRQGRVKEAAALYGAILAREPRNADAAHLLGVTHMAEGRLDEALKLIGRAIGLAPSAAMYVNRAGALRRAGRDADALTDCDAALARDPALVEAHALRGDALANLGRLDEALGSYDAAIALRPDPALRLRRADALLGGGRAELALAAFRDVLGQPGAPAAALRGEANALYALGRFEDALAAYDRATAQDPGNAVGHFNRGNTLRVLKQFEAAIAAYDAAIAKAPTFAVAHHNRALCLLHLGRLAEGFAAYEWRKRCPTFDDTRYQLPRAWTGGEDLAGKTLFVFPELFQGDMIQFCRYAWLAEQAGARVVLGAPMAMHRLLRSLSPTIELIGPDETPDRYDLQAPLMSLPHAFGVTLDSLPGAASYLSPEPERVARWRARLGADGFKVGVVWQGSTLPYSIPLQRSFPLVAAAPLAAVPGVRLVSLQKHNGLDQLDALPAGMTVETLGDDFDPGPDAFVDTAAAMACCDLVVTVDTSVAHLAGAIGAPAWVALPYVADWRWLSDRPDCPWYPSLQLFRQASRGQWGEVFSDMTKALHERVAQRLA